MKMKINVDPPIHCCHKETFLSFDTIIHYVLLCFKCLRYPIIFSIYSDSQLKVGLNARCKINRMFNDGDISQHQKYKFYNYAWTFYKRSLKYVLDNLTHSDNNLTHYSIIEHLTIRTILFIGVLFKVSIK